MQFRNANIDLRKLHLNWRGEPTLNKRLPELLQIKHTILPSVPLEFHTHGQLLNQDLAESIVTTLGPKDRVYVSIDGGWPEAHEANRGPGTWRGALQGLGRLLDAREANEAEGPIIGIYEIAYERRTRAHPDLVSLARRCDEWTRVNKIEDSGEEASFATAVVPHGPCFWVGNALCITARGDAHVCLLSFRPDGKLGNLFQEELGTILDRSDAFRERMLAVGRPAIAHCQNCRKTEGAIDDDWLVDA